MHHPEFLPEPRRRTASPEESGQLLYEYRERQCVRARASPQRARLSPGPGRCRSRGSMRQGMHYPCAKSPGRLEGDPRSGRQDEDEESAHASAPR